ncbi:MAG: tRNA (adenosine(37)-N6)-dimethylallyltransferase MiaA [Bacillota bacterium]|nr:tRNA (adenosine(37)-N6)-dimethylallyltransferase MiaA [Bacillota bacterium]
MSGQAPGEWVSLVLVGPTAVGKSELALRLAERFHGAVLTADSAQVYRGMDVGTDKPRLDQRRRIPHYGIDLAEPVAEFSVANWLRAARDALAECRRSRRLPVVAGGTGLYVEALLRGYRFAPTSPRLRQQLLVRLQEEGPEPLLRELAARDPATYATIDRRNPRRLLRALERAILNEEPGGWEQRGEGERPALPDPAELRRLLGRTVIVGLCRNRAELVERIRKRIAREMADGLLEEVAGLLARGVPRSAASMQALGYRQLAAHLLDGLSLEGALDRLDRDTRRFAKRQMAWFRNRLPGATWFNLSYATPGEVEGWVESAFARSAGMPEERPAY